MSSPSIKPTTFQPSNGNRSTIKSKPLTKNALPRGLKALNRMLSLYPMPDERVTCWSHSMDCVQSDSSPEMRLVADGVVSPPRLRSANTDKNDMIISQRRKMCHVHGIRAWRLAKTDRLEFLNFNRFRI